MTAPHPFPYQGSKRKLAPAILPYVPTCTKRVVEPFAGSAAISLACADEQRAGRFWLNDSNPGVIALWKSIVTDPDGLAGAYEQLWQDQTGKERAFYNEVRERYNETQEAPDLLYLVARCVKAAIRYNAQGQFNQSPDHRRKGMRPDKMRANLIAVSKLLGPRTKTTCRDYQEVFNALDNDDLVYMDPPYQGVSNTKDSRYCEGVDFDEFVAALEGLNNRSVMYIISYDGRTGDKQYGKPLPSSLKLEHVELDAGQSSQATLLGKKAKTVESLYVSPAAYEASSPL